MSKINFSIRNKKTGKIHLFDFVYLGGDPGKINNWTIKQLDVIDQKVIPGAKHGK